MYVVDGLFDTRNTEFEGRASVGLDLGRPCVLEDGIDHGLFVAGLVGGRRTGVATKAKIVAVGSSYGCEGSESASQRQMVERVVRAVNWVAENARKPAVVNLSLNTEGDQPELTAAVARLVDAGLTVVASAGNGGENGCGHAPAGLRSDITVTGSTKADGDAGLNYGTCVDLYAPASGVTSVVGPGAQSEPAGQERPGRHLLGRSAGQRCRRPVPVHASDSLTPAGPSSDDRQRHHRCHRRRSSRNAEPPALLPLTSVGPAQVS